MKQLWSQINKRTFLAPAIFFIIVLIIAFGFPTQFADAMNTALNWSLSSLGWVWLLSASFFLLVLLWLAFGKAGNIRFGGKDAVPDSPYLEMVLHRPYLRYGGWMLLLRSDRTFKLLSISTGFFGGRSGKRCSCRTKFTLCISALVSPSLCYLYNSQYRCRLYVLEW